MAKDGRDVVTGTHELFRLLTLTEVKSVIQQSVVSKISSCMQVQDDSFYV